MTDRSGPALARLVDARRVLRRRTTAALATLDAKSGAPYASLVTVATAIDATPIMLMSELALHRRNIAADPRVSLLFEDTDPNEDPLARARVSVAGRAEITSDNADRRRFLARHSGAYYADFGDFDFFRVIPEGAHFVAGFGRVHAIAGEELVFGRVAVAELDAAESGILEHMNEDHADAIALYATMLHGAEPGGWRMTALDPEGADLSNGSEELRIDFPDPISTPDEARAVFVALAHQARSRAAD